MNDLAVSSYVLTFSLLIIYIIACVLENCDDFYFFGLTMLHLSMFVTTFRYVICLYMFLCVI